MTEGVGVELWGVSPESEHGSRAAVWPEVIVVVPIHPDASAEADTLATKRVVFPRVPVAGEQVEVVGRWAVVDQVRWERRAPATVQIHPLVAVSGLREALEVDGFSLVARHDGDERHA
jgi:hypothetical protein